MTVHRRTSGARTVGAAAVGLALAAGLAVPANADPTTPLTGYAPDRSSRLGADVVSPSLSGRDGRVSVFVQTTGQSALEVQSTARSASSVQQRVDEIDATAATVEAEASTVDSDVEVLYVTRYTVPGVALSLDASSIETIAAMDDVVKISAIRSQTVDLPNVSDPANINSDALVSAFQAWGAGGATGEGVNIAVIDTGIDYTHAAFGGPGTVEAYDTAVASTAAPDPSWFDATKYLGGYDFAGSTYNADPNSPTFQPVPAADENPIDGRGGSHGTHVAGTAAGYGVVEVEGDGVTFGEEADGTRTPDAYASVDESVDFVVGPGSAPDAGLFSLKVFGDTGGSTDLTGAAIDWVGEAIADGQQIDVVNLSLGSDFGAVDDPENAMLAALMDQGVLPVIASGNAGDITDVAGTPSNTARTLSVAASASGRGLQDGVLDLTSNVTYGAQYSQAFTGTFTRDGAVVPLSDPTNLEGCLAYSTEDAAAVAGNFVLVEWNDDVALPCGSAVRFNNAAAAGATGVILTSTVNSFESGIAGNDLIPGAQVTADASAVIRPLAEAGTLQVRLSSDLFGQAEFFDPTKVDTIASFSSRGEHGSYNDIVKPDVSAPGVGIISAGSGTGAAASVKSGTSMATPLTAGVAALVYEAHPTWDADTVKAQIINTATHDVVVSGDDPTAYAPARAGSGRIDAFAAVTNQVTAATDDAGGLVTASFGIVEVGADGFTDSRTITVTNHGTDTASYTPEYLPRTTVPGVEYSVSPATVTVPAGGTATATVTLTVADPTQLRRTLDPTMEAAQSGIPRQFVSDASGVLELVPTDDARGSLRVSVFSAPKPVSDVHAAPIVLEDAAATTAQLALSGPSLAQGTGSEGYYSTAVPLQLGVVDPVEEFPADSASKTLSSLDVVAAGASSTAPQLADPSEGLLTFGVVMDGDWGRLLPHSYPVVSIDTDNDGVEDFYTYITPIAETVDLVVALTVDSATDEIVDYLPVNLFAGDVDTNQFDTNVATLSVPLAALGYTAESTDTTISYHVETYSEYAPRSTDDPASTLVDITDVATFDVFSPAVSFGSTTGAAAGDDEVFFEGAEGVIPVTFATTEAPAGIAPAALQPVEGAPQVLVLHLNNAVGLRSDIVDVLVDVPEPTEPPAPTDPPVVEPPAPSDPPGPGLDPTSVPTDPTQAEPTAAGGPGSLSQTGADSIPTALLAAGLLVAAGATALTVRRRRAATHREG
ncbi:subtilase family protease [Sanguibacter keddieii DSM 10542]|uniref:Subtilase family protease n=1 Tax=Sanguibacter keddieii (strain ATCC 51767 / DSM 10542 / NCFB 3025 / ST-74) TaxID=446469 RepID=D1BK09_SANKS|nr:S8 family serine peptidase [Sanguibacter keddieii]ACZ22418.1 subtilase family protease [Sanguibacter keddieii DSM 10542]